MHALYMHMQRRHNPVAFYRKKCKMKCQGQAMPCLMGRPLLLETLFDEKKRLLMYDNQDIVFMRLALAEARDRA
jgi:cytidine deaminase